MADSKPVPWCIEIEFFDGRPSEMYPVLWIVLDVDEIKFAIDDGTVYSYDFKSVSKVLSMHSSVFDFSAGN